MSTKHTQMMSNTSSNMVNDVNSENVSEVWSAKYITWPKPKIMLADTTNKL